jgi:CBS domain-containing protein
MRKEVVRDIMTRRVVSITEASNALEAAKLMTENAISSLIVTRIIIPLGFSRSTTSLKRFA